MALNIGASNLLQTIAEGICQESSEQLHMKKEFKNDITKILDEIVESDQFTNKIIKMSNMNQTSCQLHTTHAGDCDSFSETSRKLEKALNLCNVIINEVNYFKNKIKTGCIIFENQLQKHPQIININNQLKQHQSFLNSLNLTEEFNIFIKNSDYNPSPKNKSRENCMEPNDLNTYDKTNLKTNLKHPINQDINQSITNTNIEFSKTKQSNAKYKIVDVPQINPEQLLNELKAENLSIDFFNIETIYTVTGNHETYQNAIITISINSSKHLEKYPYLYINRKKKRAHEIIYIMQCTLCWSYDHSKSKCTSKKSCKNCSSDECIGNDCSKFCQQCHISQAPSNHRVGNHDCSTYKLKCNIQKYCSIQHQSLESKTLTISTINMNSTINDHQSNKDDVKEYDDVKESNQICNISNQ